MLADHHGNALLAMSPEQREQLAVPEREDHSLPRGAQGVNGLVVHSAHPPRRRQQAKHERSRPNDPANARLAHDAERVASPWPPASSIAIDATRSAAPASPSSA